MACQTDPIAEINQLEIKHMDAKLLTPILNVSDIEESFAWFEKLGWQKSWDWGSPPDFGCVSSGDCEIFLCLNGQGGRGRNELTATPAADEIADNGIWLCIMVDDVDLVHQHCLKQNLEVIWPPTDVPWGLREMRLRHPDGHVFRLGHPLSCPDSQ